jgi:serine/threonine protein kinase/tetratricopeptide (TPR) repeat protein
VVATLGPFTLQDVVGSGGAGVVWRARHAERGLPVAIKVLPPRADALALHVHKNEIQAVARLDHPHIVALLDTGVVDAAATRSSRAPLVPGSPWHAIELASGGDLQGCTVPLPFRVVSDILRSLLSALAHAHARGVIHKDIKPSNVLLCTDDDLRPGLKLTDFGLAQGARGAQLRATDDVEGESGLVIDGGTPVFMAPEQFAGAPEELGPWTDLYALACVARWLVVGVPPFASDDRDELEELHRHAALPRLPRYVDAPRGFQGWLQALLAKDPTLRPRCAADADAALAALDPHRPPPPLDRLPAGLAASDGNKRPRAGWSSTSDDDPKDELASAPTLLRRDGPSPGAATASAGAPNATSSTRAPTFGSGDEDVDDSDAAGAAVDGDGQGDDEAFTRLPVAPVAVPAHWRGVETHARHPGFVVGGLGLAGLRSPAFVGRTAERDALWQTLVDVHTDGRARAVVVRGPSGLGKTRLVEWLARRAQEVGAAEALRARCSSSSSRGDGFAALVGEACGIGRLEGTHAVIHGATWLRRWLGDVDVTPEELAALAGRTDGVFVDAAARQDALTRWLVAMAASRPLLVHLDDVHLAPDAIDFVARVLSDVPELRALFVLTVVDDVLDAHAGDALARLLSRPASRQLGLGPLDPAAHDELCTQLLLGTGRGLVDTLRARTEGNPQFAVQLVGSWRARALLVATPDGLAARDDDAWSSLGEVPNGIASLWEQRARGALRAITDGGDSDDGDVARVLEVCAVLGTDVDLVEAAAVVDAVGIAGSTLDVAVDVLVAGGLARRTGAGVRFVHALARAALEQRARRAERLDAHHAVVARVLGELWGTHTPTAAARIGRHLLAAGAPGAATRPLFVAARAAVEAGEVLEAAALLADWHQATTASGLADDDDKTAAGHVLRARVAHQQGRHDEARAIAARAAEATADQRVRAAALRTVAAASLALGAWQQAEASFDAARRASEAVADEAGYHAALRGRGDVAYYRGDFEGAARDYRAVADVLMPARDGASAPSIRAGRASDLASLLWSLGYVELEQGRIDEARRLFREQRTVARAARDRAHEANAENALGEIARRTGSLHEAGQRYEKALALARAGGLARRWTFQLNLAHLKLHQGDTAGAAAVAVEVLGTAAADEPVAGAAARFIVAIDAGLRADVAAWDAAVDAALPLAARGVVEADLIEVARRAGDAIVTLDRARAERVWHFVRGHARRPGPSP